MNSKIKSIILASFLFLSFSTSGVSYAASLSVCGEVTPATGGTAYDNYKDYQTWLLQGDGTYKIDGKNAGIIALLQAGKITQEQYYKLDTAYKSKNHICQTSDIFKQIARVINYLIGMIGLFVIVRIVYSGAQMILAQGNAEGIKKARAGITNALIGLIIVFAAYLIVNIIFQTTGVQGFNINPFA